MTRWMKSKALVLVGTYLSWAAAQPATLYVPGVATEELPAATAELRDEPIEPQPNAEIVRERYDNRRVKVEREVVQDEDQNYINHGRWKMWDRDGNVAVEGRYKHSQRDGVWTRIYRNHDAKLLSSTSPFNQANLPLVSQARFEDGKLHGRWVIYDATNKRQLCDWEFKNGRRDGISTWWYPSGAKMREIHYVDGAIDGEFNEWDRTGKQVTSHVYDEGRRLAKKVDYYSGRVKKSEGAVLYPKLALETPDDWLECTLATYSQEGAPVRHGMWTTWYANGQKKMEGEYKEDVPHGKFSWWHENGQKSLVANYRNGKRDGDWIWWHENGQKSIQGAYVMDDPSDKWLWWKESGKVAQRADFSDPKQREQILAMPNQNASQTSPSARVPLKALELR